MKTIWDEARSTPQGYWEADPSTVQRHRSEARLVDVRQPNEYEGELGHVHGAELVPLATVRAHFQNADRDDAIVLICRSGGRSAMAARQLSDMGFRTVINMTGGMLEWNATGLPVERLTRVARRVSRW